MLKKKRTNYRQPLTPEEKLVITLRFLASGESFRSLALRFRRGRSTTSEVVKETCNAIWEALNNKYLPHSNKEAWLATAENFYKKWNFPNCIGALDKKHIEIKCPARSGSTCNNYKENISISLQAMADADGKLITIDVGRQSDSGLFRSSDLYKLLESEQLDIPDPSTLPGTDVEVPYVIIADEGYPLLPYLMRPFPQRNLDNQRRIYNYRLSRARRSVECSFDVLTNKWRILSKQIETDVTTAVSIVKAVCILHNYILDKEGQNSVFSHAPEERIQSAQACARPQGRLLSGALNIRETLCNYFNGVGKI